MSPRGGRAAFNRLRTGMMSCEDELLRRQFGVRVQIARFVTRRFFIQRGSCEIAVNTERAEIDESLHARALCCFKK